MLSRLSNYGGSSKAGFKDRNNLSPSKQEVKYFGASNFNTEGRETTYYFNQDKNPSSRKSYLSKAIDMSKIPTVPSKGEKALSDYVEEPLRLENLPVEIIMSILDFLPIEYVKNLSISSKYFNGLCEGFFNKFSLSLENRKDLISFIRHNLEKPEYLKLLTIVYCLADSKHIQGSLKTIGTICGFLKTYFGEPAEVVIKYKKNLLMKWAETQDIPLTPITLGESKEDVTKWKKGELILNVSMLKQLEGEVPQDILDNLKLEASNLVKICGCCTGVTLFFVTACILLAVLAMFENH